MEKGTLIGLCGWQGSGKTTVANFLKDLGFIEVGLADVLKELSALIVDIPLEVLRAETPELREQRETMVCKDFGITGREALEQIGTDLFRKHFHPDTWLIVAFRQVNKLLAEGKSVVISDIRFVNEFKKIKQTNGTLWYIVRDETKTVLTDEMRHTHPSKWEHLLFCDQATRINNFGTLDGLNSHICELISS